MAEPTHPVRPGPTTGPNTTQSDESADAKRRRRNAAKQRHRRAMIKAVGPLHLPGDIARNVMLAARAAGFTYRQMARVSGLNEESLERVGHPVRETGTSKRSTLVRVLEAVEKLAAERRAALDDLEVHLEALTDQLYPTKRWDAEPLRAQVRDAGISVNALLGGTDRRYFYRSRTMRTERADEICLLLGLMPEEVWGHDWTLQSHGDLGAAITRGWERPQTERGTR